MFESLTDKLQSVFDRLATKGKLTETDVNAAMREVRLALLEADVNYKVVKDFIERVKVRAVGAEVMQSLTPAQQVVKIVHEELIELLGKPAPTARCSSKCWGSFVCRLTLGARPSAQAKAGATRFTP